MTLVIHMNDSRLATFEQIREFLAGTADVSLTSPADQAQTRQFVGKVLKRFNTSTDVNPSVACSLPTCNASAATLAIMRLGASARTATPRSGAATKTNV